MNPIKGRKWPANKTVFALKTRMRGRKLCVMRALRVYLWSALSNEKRTKTLSRLLDRSKQKCVLISNVCLFTENNRSRPSESSGLVSADNIVLPWHRRWTLGLFASIAIALLCGAAGKSVVRCLRPARLGNALQSLLSVIIVLDYMHRIEKQYIVLHCCCWSLRRLSVCLILSRDARPHRR